MILTYKIKHGRDFSAELAKAKQVAEFSLTSKSWSSATVKHIGLKSVIAAQILKKYSRIKNIKKISRVNLIIPGQAIKFNAETKQIWISCLKLRLDASYLPPFTKINQIECNKEYAFVSLSVVEKPQIEPKTWLGVDLNTTGHCCVVANPTTGKVLKLGKKAHHTHKKYKNQRKMLQKKGKQKLVKKIKNRESRIVRDLNHKMSRKVVNYAVANNAGIVLENLKGIRGTKRQAKSFKYSLHSWSFAQLRNFIEYKATMLGVPVAKIDPRYTSQQCSRCGLLGERKGKQFKCSNSEHVEVDADVNASFVIALRHTGALQLPVDRDIGKGSTDTP